MGKLKTKILMKVLLWILNSVLKRILESKDAEQKQKDIIWLANTVIDSIRDHQLTEDELGRIKDAFARLMTKSSLTGSDDDETTKA